MAKNDITYSCGHTVTEQLYGKMSERERVIERAAGRLCAACYQAKLEAERAEKAAAAAEAASREGLPALSGTAKQVAWAETIRAQQLPALRDLAEKLAKPPATANAEAVRIAQEIIASAIACDSAKEWIDSRDRIIGHPWISAQVKARMLAVAK